MRLRLEALLLLETVLSEAEGRYEAPGASSTAQHHSLAAVQEDLRQVRASTPTPSQLQKALACVLRQQSATNMGPPGNAVLL